MHKSCIHLDGTALTASAITTSDVVEQARSFHGQCDMRHLPAISPVRWIIDGLIATEYISLCGITRRQHIHPALSSYDWPTASFNRPTLPSFHLTTVGRQAFSISSPSSRTRLYICITGPSNDRRPPQDALETLVLLQIRHPERIW